MELSSKTSDDIDCSGVRDIDDRSAVNNENFSHSFPILVNM